MYKEKLPKNCPPKSAIENDDSLILFRVFIDSQLNESEFISYNNLYLDNQRFQKICEAFAVSFFITSEKALDKCKKLFEDQNKKIGSFIAQVKLKPKIGKYKVSDTGHCNVWFYANFQIPNDIELLELKEINYGTRY